MYKLTSGFSANEAKSAVTSPYLWPSIIKAVEWGKKSVIAEGFSVDKSTITSIVKNKQKIVDASDKASFAPEGSVTQASKCLQVLKSQKTLF